MLIRNFGEARALLLAVTVSQRPLRVICHKLLSTETLITQWTLQSRSLHQNWNTPPIISYICQMFGLHPDWTLSMVSRSMNSRVRNFAQWATVSHCTGSIPVPSLMDFLPRFHSGRTPKLSSTIWSRQDRFPSRTQFP